MLQRDEIQKVCKRFSNRQFCISEASTLWVHFSIDTTLLRVPNNLGTKNEIPQFFTKNPIQPNCTFGDMGYR